LQKTDGLENSGALIWQLVLALFVAWVLVFICLFKGIKSSGKVKLFLRYIFLIDQFKKYFNFARLYILPHYFLMLFY
jgi:hypothetical protein